MVCGGGRLATTGSHSTDFQTRIAIVQPLTFAFGTTSRLSYRGFSSLVNRILIALFRQACGTETSRSSSFRTSVSWVALYRGGRQQNRSGGQPVPIQYCHLEPRLLFSRERHRT